MFPNQRVLYLNADMIVTSIPLKTADPKTKVFHAVYRILARVAVTRALTFRGLAEAVGGLVPAIRRRAPYPPPLF